jgi:hypothetical protein
MADLPKFSHGAANVEMKSLNLCKMFVICFCQYRNELGTHFVWLYVYTMILSAQFFDDLSCYKIRKLILVHPGVLLKLHATDSKHQLQEMEVRPVRQRLHTRCAAPSLEMTQIL